MSCVRVHKLQHLLCLAALIVLLLVASVVGLSALVSVALKDTFVGGAGNGVPTLRDRGGAVLATADNLEPAPLCASRGS